jgi:hypothetical protein
MGCPLRRIMISDSKFDFDSIITNFLGPIPVILIESIEKLNSVARKELIKASFLAALEGSKSIRNSNIVSRNLVNILSGTIFVKR